MCVSFDLDCSPIFFTIAWPIGNFVQTIHLQRLKVKELVRNVLIIIIISQALSPGGITRMIFIIIHILCWLDNYGFGWVYSKLSQVENYKHWLTLGLVEGDGWPRVQIVKDLHPGGISLWDSAINGAIHWTLPMSDNSDTKICISMDIW